MKKMYEACWEIFNQCANNQMRDIQFEEVELEDPEEYVRAKFKDKNFTYEKTVLMDLLYLTLIHPVLSRDILLRRYSQIRRNNTLQSADDERKTIIS